MSHDKVSGVDMGVGKKFWIACCEIEEKLYGCSDRTIGITYENMSAAFKQMYANAGYSVFLETTKEK